MSLTAQFCLSAVIGVLASVIASAIFWVVLFQIRPKIEISPQISRSINSDGSKGFRVKLINRSRRAAVDLQPSVFLDTLRKHKTGDVHMLRLLPVKSTPGFLFHGYDKNDADARYARRLLITDDLDATWVDDQISSIVVRLFARDGRSGAFRQFEQTYRLKRDAIKDGDFDWGDSFEIS
jgi:hypothetical protein